MRNAIVQDGLFEVNELGEVYRISGGKRVLATPIKAGRNGRYRVVTAYVEGKQRRYYIHRLVAEAFIPNPNGYQEINHIDGNPANNRAENLEWVTRSQNAVHAYRTGLINPYRNAKPCLICGELTNAKDGVCVACKPEARKEARADDKTATLREQMAVIDRSKLTPTERKYVDLRESGASLNQIAAICGVSRQCVDQAIKHSMVKSLTSAAVTSQAKKEAIRLEARAKKKRISAEKLAEEAKMLFDEAEKIEAMARCICPSD